MTHVMGYNLSPLRGFSVTLYSDLQLRVTFYAGMST
jgi:hypothetical protein